MEEIIWLYYISHNSPTMKDAKSWNLGKKTKCKDLLVFSLLSWRDCALIADVNFFLWRFASWSHHDRMLLTNITHSPLSNFIFVKEHPDVHCI